MKHSYLCDNFLSTNTKSKQRYYNNRYPNWSILNYNMVEPITPSVILKRCVYET